MILSSKIVDVFKPAPNVNRNYLLQKKSYEDVIPMTFSGKNMLTETSETDRRTHIIWDFMSTNNLLYNKKRTIFRMAPRYVVFLKC